VKSQRFSRRKFFFTKLAREDYDLVVDHPVVPDKLTLLDEGAVSTRRSQKLKKTFKSSVSFWAYWICSCKNW